MSLKSNTTDLKGMQDQVNTLPPAPQSVDGVEFGDTGATGDYAISGEWLDNTATQIQNLTGATSNLTTAQMQSELTTAKTNIDETKALISEMTGATGELSLEQMKAKVETANAEKEEQAALIADLASVLAETSAVLDGKASGSSEGITCEIVTMGGGASQVATSLTRITSIHGGISNCDYYDYESSHVNQIVGVCDTSATIMDASYDALSGSVICDFAPESIFFSDGFIICYGGKANLPVTLMLINDPDKPSLF